MSRKEKMYLLYSCPLFCSHHLLRSWFGRAILREEERERERGRARERKRDEKTLRELWKYEPNIIESLCHTTVYILSVNLGQNSFPIVSRANRKYDKYTAQMLDIPKYTMAALWTLYVRRGRLWRTTHYGCSESMNNPIGVLNFLGRNNIIHRTSISIHITATEMYTKLLPNETLQYCQSSSLLPITTKINGIFLFLPFPPFDCHVWPNTCGPTTVLQICGK